jgi:hypothetical protein
VYFPQTGCVSLAGWGTGNFSLASQFVDTHFGLVTASSVFSAEKT